MSLFILGLLLSGCDEYKPFEERIEDDFIISLKDTTGVRANGVSYITLSLTNTKEVKEGLKVSFETNKGTLLQSLVNFENHKAETKLLLSQDTGIYFIKASVKDGEKVKLEKSIQITFQKGLLDQEFYLTITDTAGVRADGTATVTLTLSSNIDVKEGLRVIFETNKGTLLASDIPFMNKNASAKLKVEQDSVVYYIRALLKEGTQTKIEKSAIFSFRRANPDMINLELDRSAYSITANTLIKTFLFRNSGLISKGSVAYFSAYQINSTGQAIDVGRFEGIYNNVSDASGKLGEIKLFTPVPNVDTPKIIYIQAKVVNDKGDTIRRTVQLPFR
jgi:hypothetical protein